jgi:RNA polymerase sigma factor (sigma-70 family)
MSIDQLLPLCIEKDQRAQLEVYQRYHLAMYHSALRIVRNPVDAEDIMHEGFLTAFDKLTQYKGENKFGGWLKQIVIRKALSFVQKKEKAIHYSLNEAVLIDTTTEENNNEQQKQLQQGLDIENDYGNIYLGETDGATRLSCAYGRLEVGRLNHTRNEIEITYAPNSEIEYVNEAVIEADYSGLKIDQANIIEYDADYSKSSFGLVAILDFEADYGSLRLDEGNTVIGEADYLTIKIGRLSSKLDLDMDYGSLSVEEIAASTKEVTVQADYTGIRLGADPDWDFAFTVETEYAGFKTDFPLDYRKKIIESTDRYYQGKHRNGINQLNLSADYGSIKLTQN